MPVKKLFAFSFLFLPNIFFNLLFAQEELTSFNTSWSAVLPGTALCEPAVTSYGFCIVTDARNIMGFSSSGTLLWEKKTSRIRNMQITALPGDFILFLNKDNNTISLYNPSGTELWSYSLNFTPVERPFAGRDGRFFLYGEKSVICMGINGKIRWQLETENQKDLPLQEQPDGSIIVFLCDENGKTRGLRISPFGEELESITFSGSIKNSNTCNEGILLTFTDGSAGLFSLKDGLADSRWVASVKGNNPLFLVSQDRKQYRLLSLAKSEITIYTINSQNGNVISSKTINSIDGTALLKTELSDSGLFLADKSKAILLDYDYKELWSANMPAVTNNPINQIIYLSNDYFVLCFKNWSMNAYHTSQKTVKNDTTAISKNVLKNEQFDYSSFAPLNLSEFNYYNQGNFFNNIKDSQIAEFIKQGDFGKSEAQWLTQTLSIAKLYSMSQSSSDFGIRTEKSVFETDSAGFEIILVQLALLCTSQSQDAAATIISNSTNKAYCRALFTNLTGYDPEGKLLDAIEKNASLAGNKDSGYLNSICDGVYSICFFMGRPAYNKKGKDILKRFLGLGYSSETRNYARETLKKIIALEL